MENQNNNQNSNQAGKREPSKQKYYKSEQPLSGGRDDDDGNDMDTDESEYNNGVPDRNSGNDDDFGSLTEGTEFEKDDFNKNIDRERED